MKVFGNTILSRCGVLVLSTTMLAGCMANPGPPPIENNPPVPDHIAAEKKPAQVDKVEQARTEIAVGVEPIKNGFNPHLIADSSAGVDDLAELVFPSAYVAGEINGDVISSAQDVPAAPGVWKTVRYTIRPEAQWSDGTPITGADFQYLWKGIQGTPGAKDTALYRTISDIRVTQGGKVVDVDFNSECQELNHLFRHLLPSHLLGEPENFAQALSSKIPAAAGRFLVGSIDQQRGQIILHRNDRFWGQAPASVERLRLVEIRDQQSAIEQLRHEQLAFADFVPQGVSEETLDMVPHIQTRTRDSSAQLGLVFNVLSQKSRLRINRAALASLLDTDRIARVAAQRSTDLALPSEEQRRATQAGVSKEEITNALDYLKKATVEHPFTIGVDPADEHAVYAARATADLLNSQGIQARVQSAGMAEISATLLPSARIDAVMSWQDVDGDAVSIASRYQCLADPQTSKTQNESATTTTRPTPESEPPTDAQTPGLSPAQRPRSENLSGFCDPAIDEQLTAFIAHPVSQEELSEWSLQLESVEHLTIPIMRERRVQALGQGMVGPSAELADWPAGLATAATWKSTKKAGEDPSQQGED